MGERSHAYGRPVRDSLRTKEQTRARQHFMNNAGMPVRGACAGAARKTARARERRAIKARLLKGISNKVLTHDWVVQNNYC